ncbi:MAG TPA: tryptophan 2,3-dioxygenase family protein [Planctomycetota bacterium]|nr:tryptophan 2,3-dioxygenase family protein [Planctomycetota bacterium]
MTTRNGDARPEDSLSPSYGAYLRLGTLLSAQSPPDFEHLKPTDKPSQKTRGLAHHDELLFIIVHQVFELWFKLVLHELSRARDLLGRVGSAHGASQVSERDIPRVTAAVDRVNEILRIATEGFRVMETMNPMNFLDFRDMLIPSSGFQSVQFRELEILAGLPEAERMDFEGVPYASKLTETERTMIEQRRREMTLRDSLIDWLQRTPIDAVFPDFVPAFLGAFRAYIDEQIAHQDRNPNLAPSQRTAARARLDVQWRDCEHYLCGGSEEQNRAHRSFLFLASYRAEPLLRWPSTLIDSLIAFEQGFRIFRFRHARMVERMIGRRTGSGGSAGTDYLDSTTNRYRVFGDLLEARNFFLSNGRIPALPHPEKLDFAFKSL